MPVPFTEAEAQVALGFHEATPGRIAEQQMRAILANTRGVGFAQVTYVTENAKKAAAHKEVVLKKVVRANVQVFNNLKEATNPYVNAVRRSMEKQGLDPDRWIESGNWYRHTDCYSIVEHKVNGKRYLYGVFNDAQAHYFVDGYAVSKATFAQFLTPSGAKELLADASEVHNKTNDVTHNVIVRAISLENIVAITANKQTI